jgi:hypothetical protein
VNFEDMPMKIPADSGMAVPAPPQGGMDRAGRAGQVLRGAGLGLAIALLLGACGGGGGATPAVPPGDGSGGTAEVVVHLSWDEVTTPGLYGYRVYTSTVAGEPGQARDVGGLAMADLLLAAGGRYYFSVSAVDVQGRESALAPAVSLDTAASSARAGQLSSFRRAEAATCFC